MKRKGIILAGGSGTRLHPVTYAVSKQLLPVFDKPMIYFPLSVLMLAEITEIAIITTPHDQEQFKRLLGDGSQWGLKFTWIVQVRPEGLAQAYILAEEFLAGAPSAMILGDNIFYGHGLPELMKNADSSDAAGTIFAHHVNEPERYGVVSFDDFENPIAIIEKPKRPASNYAVTGIYFLDGDAPRRARQVQPSGRGELEITSLLESYLRDQTLDVQKLGRGFTWLDAGTHDSLLDAANLIRAIQKQQGLLICNPDQIAAQLGRICSDNSKSYSPKCIRNSRVKEPLMQYNEDLIVR